MSGEWDNWILGKSAYEVFQMIGERTKAGKLTPAQAKVIWKRHKELNEDAEIRERRAILDKLF